MYKIEAKEIAGVEMYLVSIGVADGSIAPLALFFTEDAARAIVNLMETIDALGRKN